MLVNSKDMKISKISLWLFQCELRRTANLLNDLPNVTIDHFAFENHENDYILKIVWTIIFIFMLGTVYDWTLNCKFYTHKFICTL